MQDIQFNKSISEEVWDDLHDTSLRAWDFSVRTFNALARAGYDSLGELVDSTESELREAIKGIRGMSDKRLERAMQQIKEKLAEKGIILPTDKEKQDILDALTETEQLQREINLLNQRLDELEASNISLEKQLDWMRSERKKDAQKALIEARELAYSKNALPQILERMKFCGTSGGQVHFCNVFRLAEKGCALEGNYLSDEELQTACYKCIDKFLREYYKA